MALRLCCKLENAANVAAPEVGVGGAEIGNPTYVPAKFNNGILSDINAEGCKFPTGANNINLDKGTIEFWAKMNFDETDPDYHLLFSFVDGANGGVRLMFDASNADFKVYSRSGGLFRCEVLTVGMVWNVGDLLHFAVIWDRTGTDIGGGKTLVLYINNVEEASCANTWDADTVHANLTIGVDTNEISYHSDAVIDQLKTYDHCKLDFSDRNVEQCNGNNPPTAPSAQQVDGQSSPTGANCISDLTPGFTAIFNDPDAGDQANAINIQVGTAAGLSDMWDSGWLADATVTPNRCAVKTYAGAALSAGTSYWWRCRFRDDDNAVGIWSAWQRFDMCEGEVPAGIGIQCIPGGPLPHRRPFTCATRMPREEPSYRFPYQFPALQFPCR